MIEPSSPEAGPTTAVEPEVDAHERDDPAPIILPPSALPPRRRQVSVLRGTIEWIVVILGSLCVTFLIHSYVLQPFRIPSTSMAPTLQVGDRVLVNKLSYDVHGVHRGDVVVFGRPTCSKPGAADHDHPVWATCEALSHIDDLVKRVVALGGETVSVHDGKVFIDDDELREPYLPKGTVVSAQVPGCSFPGSYRVPAGDVFVMGDNRGVSFDSRCFGPIPTSLIVGRAFLRIWPLGRIDTL